MAKYLSLEYIQTAKKSKSCSYFKIKALITNKTDSINKVIIEKHIK